jgi:hypothetical protein
MIITNSTPDRYYYEQLIAFLMSVKVNSPKHLNLFRIFLANYPKDLQSMLEAAFPEVTFENNNLRMTDKRGFSLIIDRAARIGQCLRKYKESVTWIDTDVIVRGDISELVNVRPRQLKILYRKSQPDKTKINAGVFTIGCSYATKSFINHWHGRISRGKKWGDGQLEFWRGFQKYKDKIKLVELPMELNSVGHFNEEYIVWHCKMGHFKHRRYQEEYNSYLSEAQKQINKVWSKT